MTPNFVSFWVCSITFFGAKIDFCVLFNHFWLNWIEHTMYSIPSTSKKIYWVLAVASHSARMVQFVGTQYSLMAHKKCKLNLVVQMFHRFSQYTNTNLRKNQSFFKNLWFFYLLCSINRCLKQSSALAKWGNPWKREIIIPLPTIFFYFSTLFSLFSFKCFLSKYTKVHLDLLEKSLVWDFANKNFLSLEIRSGFQFQAMSLTDFQIQLGKRLSTIYYLHSILEKVGGSTKTSKQFWFKNEQKVWGNESNKNKACGWCWNLDLTLKIFSH